ncbi:MltR family transcriptional regulator [Roseateles microcysteis]|uniref:MltR family transcriptional regulator n=1 Tax=Roseateles microcysteis TaxID=3119057 RepID=UPI002FE559C7
MTTGIPEPIKKQYEEFVAFRRALSDESDRGCALFAAAYLDTALEGLFRASILEGKKTDEELFEGSAPLATFSARIKLAYYLGIVSAEVRADLETIRKIRNDFAHDATILSFESQSIADRCRHLGFSYQDAAARPRAHFTAAASGLVAIVHGLAHKAKRPRLKPDDRPSEKEKVAARRRAEEATRTMLQSLAMEPPGDA